MYLGNSRLLQGKTTNEVVLGEWLAVAPENATNGQYGTTGTESEVYTMEWVVSQDVLFVGGKFNDIVNGSTTSSANSIAMFDDGWKSLTGINGATAGVREISLGQNNLGTVHAIRDIRNSGDTKTMLIGGEFTFAGGIQRDSDLNLAQYSLGIGWTGQAASINADGRVLSISNVDFDGSGITTYFGGEFGNVGGNNFSLSLGAYRYNTSINTSSLTSLGSNFDNDSFPIISVLNDTVKDKLYVYYSDNDSTSGYTIRKYEYNGTSLGQTATAGNAGVFQEPISQNHMIQIDSNYVYILTPKKVYYSNPNTSFNIFEVSPFGSLDKMTEINSVLYNSGTHTYLLVSLQDNSSSNIKFYKLSDNLVSGTEKIIPVPDGLKGTGSKINAIAVNQNDGTVYVGGKFVFRDSNGNTAWNVAKFKPSPLKFNPK